MRFILLLSQLAFATTPTNDPSYCLYWLERFSHIARYEELLQDLDTIRRDYGFCAAVDQEIQWRMQIKAMMAQIEMDNE